MEHYDGHAMSGGDVDVSLRREIAQGAGGDDEVHPKGRARLACDRAQARVDDGRGLRCGTVDAKTAGVGNGHGQLGQSHESHAGAYDRVGNTIVTDEARLERHRLIPLSPLIPLFIAATLAGTERVDA
jgi:hypothetical protein